MKFNKYLKRQITFVKKELREEDINTKVLNVYLYDANEENEKVRKKLLKDGIIGCFHHIPCFNCYEEFFYYHEIKGVSDSVRDILVNGTYKVLVNFYGTSKIKKKFDVIGLMGFFLDDLIEEEYSYYYSDKESLKKRKNHLVASE